MKVGMPVMKLNAGNINAVIREAWLRDNETKRNCGDPDYQPELTKENVYLLGDSLATDVIRNVETRKQSYEQLKGRKMRKDAVLTVAGIIKPNGDQFNRLSRDRQMQFFRDSLDILQGEEFFNGNLTNCVVQVDEGVPHAHWSAIPIAPDGTWSAKKVLNLKMLNKLNSLYPERMQARGWDVQSLTRFDEDAYRAMTAEEKAAYVEKKRKAHGKSSAEFKAEAEAEKILAQANTKAVDVLSDALARTKAYEADKKAEIDERAEKAAEAQIAALTAEIEDLKERRQAAIDELDDIYDDILQEGADTLRGRALAVLLDWIPTETAERIREGLSWILRRHRELRGAWPIRRQGSERKWPGDGKEHLPRR